MKRILALVLLGACAGGPPAGGGAERFDVVVVGATPGGIMAAIGAARGGCRVALLDRNAHIGGLPANGLGATDIGTRGATGGLFLEFVTRVREHYERAYGAASPQAKACSQGYHFEPSVGARVLEAMVAEHPAIAVLRRRQFDADVVLDRGTLREIAVTNRDTGARERYAATVFVDGTYEGDLAAAAGAPFRLGREAKSEFDEPMAGRLYKGWRVAEPGPGSTGEGGPEIQAFNFRLCLTKDAANRAPVPKPASYRREEFASLADDVRLGRYAGIPGAELESDGIGRVVNMVLLPNGKTDSNNQHMAFLSTDLPEENWPWPTATWEWRDRFAERLRDYTLGLLWFVQNDPALPEDFRRRASEWGLAKDEYADNGNFPRQAYVREGRRIVGDHLFTAHDAIPAKGSERPPIHAASITASHYALDSHAVRKREPDRVHLDGFFSHPTRPYTVPYGVIVPKQVEGLLTPVPVSGTHVGFSTLRMEPCWMALGQAAGVAAGLALKHRVPPRKVDVAELQRLLLQQKAVLIYFKDVAPGHPHYEAIQYWGLHGLLPGWEARPDDPVTPEVAARWCAEAGLPRVEPAPARRGEFLTWLYLRATTLAPYKGWEGALFMKGAGRELVSVPDIAGRIVSWGLDGDNLIWENPKYLGKTIANADPESIKQGYTGYQIDLGPELRGIPQHLPLWMGPYSVTWMADGVKLSSAHDPAVGMTIEKEYRLDPKSGALRIVQRMRNSSDRDQSYCLWDRTLCKGGGFALIPLNPKSGFKAGWSHRYGPGYVGDDPKVPEAKVLEGVLVVKCEGKPTKLGADSDAGWIAYVRGRQLFVKYYPWFADGRYTDGGNSVELYFDGNVGELEPLSPEVALKPGEAYEFPEEWTLTRLEKEVTTPEEARALVSKIPPSPLRRSK